MALRSAGLTASLALAANAFMIPSTISIPDASVYNIDPLMAAHQDAARVVKVPCPGCSFEGKEAVDNSMVLAWSLTDDKSTLLLNGREFYSGKLASWARSFPTVQVPSSTSLDDIRSRLADVSSDARDLYYRVFERFTHAADGTDAQLIDVDFAVNSLGDEHVYGADSLTLRILKDEQGRLAIADVVQVPADRSKPAHEDDAAREPETGKDDVPEEPEQNFNILPVDHPTLPTDVNTRVHEQMDRIKATATRLHDSACVQIAKSTKGQVVPAHCNKAIEQFAAQQLQPAGVSLKGGMPKFWMLGHPAGQMGQMHHQHPHPHTRGGCRKGHFLRAMRRIVFGFLLPVLVGVTAGLGASLLGMLVGTTLAMLWMRCVRGGRRGNASARIDEVAADEEEKAGLMHEAYATGEEQLPAYEDAPAYEREDKA